MIDNFLDLLLMKINVFEENIYAMLDMRTSARNMLKYSKYLGDGRTSFSNFRYNVDQSSYFHKYENIYNYHEKFILLL